MRLRIIELIVLLSLFMLLLVAATGLDSQTKMKTTCSRQISQATSTLKILLVEPMGYPGSGSGQGPHAV
jgi:hypothetical protein